MGVKITIGMSDSQMLASLKKQRASWEKNTKATEAFTGATAKAEAQAVRYGKAVVKQNRTAEQVLRDRIAAVELAGEREGASAEEVRHTIDRLISKYRESETAAIEAARKGTEAYKEEQREIGKGVAKVNELKAANQTLEAQYDEIKGTMKAAFNAGKISAKELETATGQLKREQIEAAKSQKKAFGQSAVDQISAYATGVISVGAAFGLARKAIAFYNEERERATGETDDLSDTRTALRQISKGDFDKLEQRADALATDKDLGITREEARKLIFAARSTGFEGEERTVAAADPVIPAEVGAAFAGEFRKFFSKEGLSIESAFNTALAGAAESQFNISQLLPQVRTAAQGAIAGGESSDVVAATSVLADNFGKSVGDRIRALGVKLATNDQTKGLNLIDAVKKLADDPELRKSIVKDSSELKAVVSKFIERGGTIQRADKRIEAEQRKVGDAGLIGKAVKEATDTSTQSGRIESSRRERIAAEQSRRKAEEEKLSSGANQARAAREEAAEEALKNGQNAVQRAAGSAGSAAISLITNDQTSIKEGASFFSNPFEFFDSNARAVGKRKRAEAELQRLDERFDFQQETGINVPASKDSSQIIQELRALGTILNSQNEATREQNRLAANRITNAAREAQQTTSAIKESQVIAN